MPWRIFEYRLLMLLVLLLFLASSAESAFPDRPLINFDAGFQRTQLSVDEGSARIVEFNGNRFLQLDAEAGERVKIRLRPASGKWNLKEYVNLAVDVANPGKDEVWFRMLIKDPGTEDESWYRPNLSHNGWVKPGEARVFPALLVRHKYRSKAAFPDYMDRFPEMHGLPHGQMLVWFGIDVARVTEMVITLEPKAHAQTLRIDNLRGNRRASPKLLESNPDAFFPFIDEYGQYMHEDWPGKVHSGTDLIKQRETEEEDLTAHPRPMAFNRYGGWTSGPTLEATGHFRVEKVDGKWWFVDPQGKLFWSLGCNSVGLHKATVELAEKGHFYANLPALDDPVYGRYRVKQGNRYHSKGPIYEKKYGSGYEAFYHRLSLRRIRSWGLNTLGAWSPSAAQQPEALRVPYCICLNPRGIKVGPIEKLADPFDPGFEKAVKASINAKWFSKADPFCVGYFDNNEIHWGKDFSGTMQKVLDECGSDVPMKQALERFVAEKGNADRATLLEFYRHMVDVYHRKCRAAINAAAPGKLYLGNRLHDATLRNELVAAQAKYCDVISFNIYEKDVERFNVRNPKHLPFFQIDKPFLIGEFNFGALDRGKFFTGIGFAADQRNRGENYVRYVKSALRNPRCVGAHWFTYCDSPTGGRTLNAENANCGTVSVADTPYPDVVNAMRSVGQGMYPYRFQRIDLMK